MEAAKIKEVKEADVFHTHIAGHDPMDLAICEQLPVELSKNFGKPLVAQLRGLSSRIRNNVSYEGAKGLNF